MFVTSRTEGHEHSPAQRDAASDAMCRPRTHVAFMLHAVALLALASMASMIGRPVAAADTEKPAAAEPAWPALPSDNAEVQLPAQEWPMHKGPRQIRVGVSYPGNKLAAVGSETGVMLTLHNWGGDRATGTANPTALAERYNLVVLWVDYLQSGKKASIDDPEPYDCGYLQALDALRALWWMYDGLAKTNRPFATGRIFATGGSGGGNVTLMANKLAPRTFACVVDLCGMKKLSHDIAFHLPGGSDLDARWNRDPQHANYLSPDAQEIRFVGHPEHAAAMKKLGNACRIVIVHGVDDATCPFADAVECADNLARAGLFVDKRFIAKADVDGVAFTSTGHSLGNRTEIVLRVADRFLKSVGPDSAKRTSPADFDRRDEEVRYKTPRGSFVISYRAGFPVGRFEPDPPPIRYDEHQDLSYLRARDGTRQPIRSATDWEQRRRQIVQGFELVAGTWPGASWRVPLAVRVASEERKAGILWKKLTYQSDPYDRVPAWLLIPDSASETNKVPAMLCLQQTTAAGKNEPVGLAGAKNMHYAIELAQRGYVVFAPDYPSFGEHAYDFAAQHEYPSGTLKAAWDNHRAVDLLAALPQVDAARIGVIGHSLGGHNAIFTALFEPRLAAVVSSCGFTTFQKDDVPSWNGPRYMPRIAATYHNDAAKVPFDFNGLVAAIAPRPFLAVAATKDSDFRVDGVRDVLNSASFAYKLLRAPDNLAALYPESPHDFPPDAREKAYQFLDRHLNTKAR